MSTRHHFARSGTGQTVVEITADGAYDLFALAGSPVAAVDVVFVVKPGVIVYGTYPNAGLRMSSTFPGGSQLLLQNFGTICGYGGGGGAGGNGGSAGLIGSSGGNAVELAYALTIDNTYGYIYGGGGGGWGGSGELGFPVYFTYGGGGGGGGQGYVGGTGGAGGTGSASNGSPGGDGSFTGPGGGGAGAYTGDSGQAWGGAVSGQTQAYAVKRNGYLVTWLGGNNLTQVKGQVA